MELCKTSTNFGPANVQPRPLWVSARLTLYQGLGTKEPSDSATINTGTADSRASPSSQASSTGKCTSQQGWPTPRLLHQTSFPRREAGFQGPSSQPRQTMQVVPSSRLLPPRRRMQIRSFRAEYRCHLVSELCGEEGPLQVWLGMHRRELHVRTCVPAFGVPRCT